MPQHQRSQTHSATLSGIHIGSGQASRTAHQANVSTNRSTPSIFSKISYDIENKSVTVTLQGFDARGNVRPKVDFTVTAIESNKGIVKFKISSHEHDDRALGFILPDKRDSKEFEINITNPNTSILNSNAHKYLSGLMRGFNCKVSGSDIFSFLSFAVARTGGLAQLEKVKEHERSILNPEQDVTALNRPGSNGLRGTAAQDMMGYNCLSFVRSLSLALLKRSPIVCGEYASASLSAECLFDSLKTKIGTQGPCGSGRFELRESSRIPLYTGSFEYFSPETQRLTESTKKKLTNLKTGDIVFLEDPDHANADPNHRPSHVGIVLEPSVAGKLFGYGAKNPVVAHVIGDTVLLDEIHDISPNGRTWPGVSENWKIAGVLEADNSSRAFPNGIQRLSDVTVDVSFVKYTSRGPQVDLSLLDISAYLAAKSPNLKGLTPRYIANSIATLNPDRVEAITNSRGMAIDYRVKNLTPLQMPKFLIAPLKQNGFLKGIASSSSTTIEINRP